MLSKGHVEEQASQRPDVRLRAHPLLAMQIDHLGRTIPARMEGGRMSIWLFGACHSAGGGG